MKGRIHSFQSLGTVDGPGVRAVVFMQGCPLRCICCHNPDTWAFDGGKEMDTTELMEKIRRLRAYFGKDGGVTVSGGEPLMQSDFVRELFTLCRKEGIHTALDTSGCVYNSQVDALIDACDMVLLDYKYTNGRDYGEKCGCEQAQVELFLQKLQEKGKRVWLRHVVIPGINDNVDSLKLLYEVEKRYSCVEKTELLPFRKLCTEKYREMGIPFRLENTPEGDAQEVNALWERAKKED